MGGYHPTVVTSLPHCACPEHNRNKAHPTTHTRTCTHKHIDAHTHNVPIHSAPTVHPQLAPRVLSLHHVFPISGAPNTSFDQDQE